MTNLITQMLLDGYVKKCGLKKVFYKSLAKIACSDMNFFIEFWMQHIEDLENVASYPISCLNVISRIIDERSSDLIPYLTSIIEIIIKIQNSCSIDLRNKCANKCKNVMQSVIDRFPMVSRSQKKIAVDKIDSSIAIYDFKSASP